MRILHRVSSPKWSENPVLAILPTLVRKEACWEVKSSEDWTNTACISADLYAKKKQTSVYRITLKVFLLVENC